MRVIVAGGRDFGDYAAAEEAIFLSGFEVTEVVSGACRRKPGNNTMASGADGLGEIWAARHGVPITRFYAALYGRWPGCGPKRNAAMAEYAQALVALPGGDGTANMIDEAQKRGLHVYIAATA